ncbi:MAG TPA: 30S ribosomal protein S6 [Aggregatilinea sp.]|jgi:small subunit ribosomal protein S6|uniref:30S ribosomal protein S6 n=1 Tax=Aggregatilinea sp. TaxID=2806333 RepID=UPI002C78C7FF|nr:30S ribosomal protein S6 [Aggregatilinea sp.]HML24761.1 30S ribosomal protein S6 [Aggregatilinea sp.]
MNHEYELGFIIPISVPETEVPAVVTTVREWVEALQGTVTNVDNWGRRRLAYPIDDYREGYYVFFKMSYPPQAVPELERQMHLSDRIIRHLVVRLDEE